MVPHEYKIKGFSLAKGIGVGKYMRNRRFTVGGHDWVIIFYPDGDSQDSQEYVSLYLELVSPGEVKATLEFKFLDQSGKGKQAVRGASECAKVYYINDYWGYKQYMKRSELETSSYRKDDCLSIHCAVGVVLTRDETVQSRDETVQTRVETVLTRVGEEKPYVIPVPPSEMIQNLKGLLESGIGSDITLQVGNEFFRAHKSILAARSPVFRAQFFGLEGNPDLETLAIKQFEPFAFMPCELSDSDSPCTSTTLMQHLLDAADCYDIPRLKLLCEGKLCEEITANNVAKTLSLAEEHQCLQLKTVCLNFASKPEIFGEVMKSDGYAYLEKSYPSLLTDLLKTSAVVDKTEA
ncbi:hypothetical protein MKW98_021090 [Papaver atlanticum]|uniref:Uncharacterized protein n=1 Tax=Papaver atlanticum TaxID=357466 RepID=A0AAD4T9Z9_9MAGN|nr:hypothetical protein MKW98_021090 [Papaver atlanticum]